MLGSVCTATRSSAGRGTTTDASAPQVLGQSYVFAANNIGLLRHLTDRLTAPRREACCGTISPTSFRAEKRKRCGRKINPHSSLSQRLFELFDVLLPKCNDRNLRQSFRQSMMCRSKGPCGKFVTCQSRSGELVPMPMSIRSASSPSLGCIRFVVDSPWHP